MGKTLEGCDFIVPEVLECPFDFYKLLSVEVPVYPLPRPPQTQRVERQFTADRN